VRINAHTYFDVMHFIVNVEHPILCKDNKNKVEGEEEIERFEKKERGKRLV